MTKCERLEAWLQFGRIQLARLRETRSAIRSIDAAERCRQEAQRRAAWLGLVRDTVRALPELADWIDPTLPNDFRANAKESRLLLRLFDYGFVYVVVRLREPAGNRSAYWEPIQNATGSFFFFVPTWRIEESSGAIVESYAETVAEWALAVAMAEEADALYRELATIAPIAPIADA